jgi:hypothetical protein
MGPEHVLKLLHKSRGKNLNLSNQLAVIKITWKMSRLSISNCPKLYLSVCPAILKIQQQKRK